MPGAMKFPKSPAELLAAFEAAFPKAKNAQRRKMFGYPCGFVNGHMFAGLFADEAFVRLPQTERETLLRAKKATPFEPMPGRPMKEYVVVPASVVARPAELGDWVERAFRYAATLPPKAGRRASRH